MTNDIDLDALASVVAQLRDAYSWLSYIDYPGVGTAMAACEAGINAINNLIDLAHRNAIPSEQGEVVAEVEAMVERLYDTEEVFDPQSRREAALLITALYAKLVAALRTHPAPAAGVKVKALPDDNDGVEQDAFEEWAKAEGFDMEQHPLHWLFLNKQTSAARKGWRAALRHAHARILSALYQGEPK